MPPSCRFRRNLAAFHTETGSFIEVHPGLLRDFGFMRASPVEDNKYSPPASANNPTPPAATAYQYLRVDHYRSACRILNELADRCFRGDSDKTKSEAERARLAAMYRLSAAQRDQLVFKVLIAVPDDSKTGWENHKGPTVRSVFA